MPPNPPRLSNPVLARLAVVIALACVPSAGLADPVEYLTPSHWAYEDLLSLWNRGVIDSLDVATRPWSRIEIARALARIPEDRRGDPIVRRLERQFAFELSWIAEGGPEETAPLLRIRDGESEARVSVGVDGRAGGAPAGDAQIEPGSGAFVRGRAYLRPSGFAVAEVRAQRIGTDRDIGDSLIKEEDFYLDAGETYVTVAPAGFEVLFGLAETRWGPGEVGTLLISDAPDPFAVLRLRKRFGQRLELGTLHGALVQSDNRYVAMHRLSYRATSSLTIGVAEAARYDATSPEFLYLLNLIPYTLLERFSQKYREADPPISQRNNVMMSGDVVWRFRRDARLWVELLLDDLATETSDMPHRLAWQTGASINLRAGRVPLDVAFEFTKVFRFTYAVSYDRNFIFGGDPLGYLRGPDTESWSLRLKADPSPDWSGFLDVDLLRRGEGFLGEAWDSSQPMDPWSGATLTGVVESVVRVVPSVAWIPRDNVRFRAGAGVQRKDNAGHVRNDTATDAEAFVELMLHK